jgi:hypothetical protein
MTDWSTLVPAPKAMFLLLAAIVAFISDANGFVLTDPEDATRCWKEAMPGSSFNMMPDFIQDIHSITPQMCKTACNAMTNATMAGITEGKFCLCGEDEGLKEFWRWTMYHLVGEQT